MTFKGRTRLAVDWGQRVAPPAALFIIITVIPTFFVSFLLNERHNSGDETPYNHFVSYMTSGKFIWYLAAVWISLLFTWLLGVLIRRKEHRQLWHLLKDDLGKNIWRGLGISTATVVVLVLFLNADDVSVIRMHAGGFFDVSLAILSLTGIYVTLNEVLDIHNSIVSFRDLLNRMEDLIRKTPQDDIIHMLVLTPAMGCMVLDLREWTKVAELLRSRDHSISLTCLAVGDMETWLSSYITQNDAEEVKKAKAERIEAGMEFSRNTITELGSKAKHLGHEPPVLGCFEDLQSVYMVANRNRAIVAVPLYLPTPSYRPEFTDYSARKAQFIGFETKDIHIIESVYEEITMRRKFIEQKQAACPEANPAPTG